MRFAFTMHQPQMFHIDSESEMNEPQRLRAKHTLHIDHNLDTPNLRPTHAGHVYARWCLIHIYHGNRARFGIFQLHNSMASNYPRNQIKESLSLIQYKGIKHTCPLFQGVCLVKKSIQ